MLHPTGTYLVCGGSDAPSLHVLTPAQREAMHARDAIAGDGPRSRALVLRYTFGVDAQYALPAWDADCLSGIALGYTGHDQAIVRGMAAALAVGRALRAADEPQPSAPVPPPANPTASGGRKARPVPVAPQPAGPAGGFFGSL
jgi:hypothetical protein